MDRPELQKVWAETIGADVDWAAASTVAAYRPPSNPTSGTPAVLAGLPRAAFRTSPSLPVAAADGQPMPTGGEQQYVLQDEIGRGGMGVVYRATQGSLQRDVAIKTLIPQRRGGDAKQKFVAEALVTGALDHPNIIPVHELGENHLGEVFLAMKLVRGHSWHDLLHPRSDAHRQAARDWPQRRHIDVLMSVCNAIAFAHSRGVVHRDLKPANIMVGDFGEIMVMDWGIALDVRDPRPDTPLAPHKSEVSGPAGTPCYMAPEQAEARNRDIGPWTDVFQLGAILHEVITATPPHAGTQLLDVLQAASRANPPVYGDEVPTALQTICRKAMAREPADRFADAAAFLEALRAYLSHAESLRLGDEGQRILDGLMDGAVPLVERYSAYARALARYEQALHLWPENDSASRGQAQAAMRYAEEALERGDGGLVGAQLMLLERHPHADALRVQTTTMGLQRLDSGRLRAMVGGALLLLLVVAIWQGLAWVQDGSAAERTRDEAVASADRSAVQAWQAIAGGDLHAISKARESMKTAQLKAGTSPGRLEQVDRAARSLQWQQERWEALFGDICRAGLNDRRADVLRRDLLNLAAVSGTALARRLAQTDTTRLGGAARLCRALHEAVLGGDPIEALLSAAAAVPEAAEAGGDDATGVDRRLLGVAICALHPASAATATEASCADSRLPFRLSKPPFGPAAAASDPARRALMPRFVHAPDGSWQAFHPRTGVLQWRSPPLPQLERSDFAIPVQDGTVIVGQGNFLLRRDAWSGRVIARQVLPCTPLAAWPDPTDRRRLVVAVWALEDQGVVQLLGFKGGPEQPVYLNDHVLIGWKSPNWLRNVRDRVFAQAAERLGVPQEQTEKDPAVRRQAMEAISGLAAADPLDPEIPLMILQLEGEAASAERRAELGQAVVRLATGQMALRLTSMGVVLERAGLRAEADVLYSRSHAALRALGLNTELSVSLLGSPAFIMRRLGDDRFAAGDLDRALALIEKGREFSDFLEGDARFYRRYSAWLSATGRPDPQGRVAALARDAASTGESMLLTTAQVRMVDVAVPVSVASPILLYGLLLALWWRARKTRYAALWTRGYRTRRQRLVAFLESPVERLRHTFLSYATRPQRLAIFGVALTALLSAAILSANVSIVLRNANASAVLGYGLAGTPGCAEVMRRHGRRRGERPALLRLLAEGAWARGERAQAAGLLGRAVALAPSDPLARNNAAVLAELSGHHDVARVGYEQAAAMVAAGNEVARWNLARLEGQRPNSAALARRDRLRLRQGAPAEPLWAMCPLADLRDLLSPDLSAIQVAGHALAGMLSGDTQAALRVAGGAIATQASPARSVSSGMGISVLAAALLALLWLPVPPLPIIPEPPAPVSDALNLTLAQRLRVWLLVALRLPLRVVDLCLPGWADLFAGRLAWAAGQLTALMLLASIWGGSGGRGPLSSQVNYKMIKHYFDGVPDPGPGFGFDLLGQLALLGLVLLFVLHAVRRWRLRSERQCD